MMEPIRSDHVFAPAVVRQESDSKGVDVGGVKDGEGSKMDPNQVHEIEWLTALRLLGLAHPHFQSKRGWGLGALTLKYISKECTIKRLDTGDLKISTYRVQILGSGVTVTDEIPPDKSTRG